MKGEREKGEEEGLIIYLCQTAAAAAANEGGRRERNAKVDGTAHGCMVGWRWSWLSKIRVPFPPFPFPPPHLLTAFFALRLFPSRRWRMSTHGTAEWSKREGSVEKRKSEQVLHVAAELETIFDKRCH